MASATAFALSAIGYRVVTAPALPDLAPTVTRTNATLDILNKPCKGDSDSCGTIASIGKLVKKTGDIEVDMQTQVRQSGTLITSAAKSLTSTSQHLDAAVDTANGQLTHVGPLLDSARGVTDALPVTLQRVNKAVDGVAPILANADGAVTDFRRFMTAPALLGTIANADKMTQAWAAISVNGQKVSDKLTADFLKPVPWYMQPVKKGGELIDIGAALARHAP